MDELTKRLITSIFLFPIVILSIYYSGLYLIGLLVVFYLICFYEILKNCKDFRFNFFSNLILMFSFYSLFYLRGTTELSFIFLLWVLVSTFLSDIGGYVVGKAIGGKKITRISPNKTYAGVIGSIIFCLSAIPIIEITQKFLISEIFIDFLSIKFFITGLTISIICQLGDLYISFLKRKLNIKDVSNILPGHGGVLDRIDGLIFVLIFIFILQKNIIFY
jgi:phosphatidate cytidylyltransferase